MAARSSLRFYRKRADLSQQELGEKVGLRADQVSRIETGYALPTLPEAEAIAKELGVTLAMLWSEATLEAIAERSAA